jgi:DNA-binding beta-propeller fold protein YncE
MTRLIPLAILLATASPLGGAADAQQAPWNGPNVPFSHRDRVYAAEQFSNTLSVTDPVDNKLLGVIKLGDPQPMNFSPLYKGQVLVPSAGPD